VEYNRGSGESQPEGKAPGIIGGKLWPGIKGNSVIRHIITVKPFQQKGRPNSMPKNMRRRPGDLARVVRVKNGYAVYTGSSWSK